jgi:NAD(P)-dependent dehydrogenase (short-subunit alcohol dehydrogenase family)
MEHYKTSLIVGASGATGRLLVEQLLNRGHHVRAVLRSSSKLPEALLKHQYLHVIEASISDATDADMAGFVNGCDAVASCLGHNLTLKGIFGHPRRLVADVTRRLCDAAKANSMERPTKFVLMNTAGNSNRDHFEPISFAQKCVIGMLRVALPPHADNEIASDYLRTVIGQTDQAIEWAAVRPDGLTDESAVSEYSVFPSPTRSAIFNSGKTSRINVAHFMAELIADDDTWNRWKGQMPVIYNVA